MKKIVRLAAMLLLVAAFAQPFNTQAYQQRQSMSEYQRRELMDFVEGYAPTRENAAKLWQVYLQLREYSGMDFYMILGQTNQWGQAHAGGVIILDVSTVGKSLPILAFVMAHEWGHEALGHQPNFYHPIGQPWRYRPLPTSDEDAADRYAGKFLAAYGYNVDAVANYLSSLPVSPPGDAHSDGPARARTVKRAANGGSGIGNDSVARRQIECQHRIACAHQIACVHSGACVHRIPCGHQTACVHTIRCQHPVWTPYGWQPAHPYDTLHPYDVAHPYDMLHQYDSLHPFDTLHPYDLAHPFDYAN